MARARSTDSDKTAKRRIDVAAAFAATDDPAPLLEAIPTLVMPRADVPWNELGDLATTLLLRIDGATSTAAIATAAGFIATPRECARELAALAERGIVKLDARDDDGVEERLDIDLSTL